MFSYMYLTEFMYFSDIMGTHIALTKISDKVRQVGCKTINVIAGIYGSPAPYTSMCMH